MHLIPPAAQPQRLVEHGLSVEQLHFMSCKTSAGASSTLGGVDIGKRILDDGSFSHPYFVGSNSGG